jgi:hypothetical protein
MKTSNPGVKFRVNELANITAGLEVYGTSILQQPEAEGGRI